MPYTVAVLTHSADEFWRRPNLLKLLFPAWHEFGIQVVVCTERARPVEADAAILHVNRSVVPAAYENLLARYPIVVNGAVFDISKRVFSELQVNQDDAVDGPVIVKTDCNYRGIPEFRHRLRESVLARFLGTMMTPRTLEAHWHRRETRRPWSRIRLLEDYPVFENKSLVPKGVWGNKHLVVERFVPEHSVGAYRCRHWLFFGDRDVGRITTSEHPMVKLNDTVEELRDPIPEELRALRKRLGFDYGKFDYGIVDGNVVVYDVNRTPGATTDSNRHASTVRTLAGGLLLFLTRSPTATFALR